MQFMLESNLGRAGRSDPVLVMARKCTRSKQNTLNSKLFVYAPVQNLRSAVSELLIQDKLVHSTVNLSESQRVYLNQKGLSGMKGLSNHSG